MKLNKPVTIAITIVSAVLIFAAGIYVGEAYVQPRIEANNRKAALAAGEAFVKNVTTRKLADAYASTAKGLQAKQSKDDFSKALTGLNGDKLVYNKPQLVHEGKAYFFSQSVDNLPPSATGSANGIFYVTLDKESGTWKVTTASVQ
jgi:hypothetical protein